MITESTIIIRLIIAVLLGSIVGYERERIKPEEGHAGLRTHMLVCLGSALFTMMGLYAFESADTARVAAGIVSGMGFLGAGTIIASGEKIKGLTTAAGLWVASAIGLAVGAGFIIPAIVASLLALFVLALKSLL